MNVQEVDALYQRRLQMFRTTSRSEKAEILSELLNRLEISPASIRNVQHARAVIEQRLQVEMRIAQATEGGYWKDVRVEVLGRGPGTIQDIQKDGAVRVKLDSGRTQAYGAPRLKKI